MGKGIGVYYIVHGKTIKLRNFRRRLSARLFIRAIMIEKARKARKTTKP